MDKWGHPFFLSPSPHSVHEHTHTCTQYTHTHTIHTHMCICCHACACHATFMRLLLITQFACVRLLMIISPGVRVSSLNHFLPLSFVYFLYEQPPSVEVKVKLGIFPLVSWDIIVLGQVQKCPDHWVEIRVGYDGWIKNKWVLWNVYGQKWVAAKCFVSGSDFPWSLNQSPAQKNEGSLLSSDHLTVLVRI